MAWFYLVVAGLFEVGWAIGLKYTDGFTRLWPSLWTGASMALSLFLLAQALRTLPVGPATQSGPASERGHRPSGSSFSESRGSPSLSLSSWSVSWV
jgi:hypothetical protein